MKTIGYKYNSHRDCEFAICMDTLLTNYLYSLPEGITYTHRDVSKFYPHYD